MECVGKVEVKTTGLVANICITEAKNPAVLMETGEVVTLMTEEGVTVGEGWDIIKLAIGSGLLRKAYEAHMKMVAEVNAVGIANALREQGYE